MSTKDSYYELKGPKRLPILGNIHQVTVNKLHQNLEKWADEFGDIYRLQLGPSKLVIITNPDMIQTILRERPHLYRRMEKMDVIFQEQGVHGVFNAEGEEWKVHRKMVAQGLDVRHQNQYFPSILKTTERLLEKWKGFENNGTAFDVQKDLVRYTVDVTTSLAFGYDMNTIEMGEDVIQNHLEKIFPTIFKRINAPIPLWRYFKTKEDKNFDSALVEINKLIDEFIDDAKQRLENNPSLKEKPNNFIEAMLIEAEKEESISNSDLRGNLLTVLMAGEDTTAHTLAWMIYFLSKYPEWQEKINDEIKAHISNGVIKDYNNLNSLKLVEAFANETMRIKPVAPLMLFEPLENTSIGKYKFNKGRRLLVQMRQPAMDDQYFSNAQEFNPNRWLKLEKCPMKHEVKGFMPFGSGPRFCPGRNLAFTEIKMVIAMLVSNFTFSVKNSENIEEVMAFTMMPSSFNISLERR